MTKKMASDVNGDDCILISESSDEKCTDDKSETISVTPSFTCACYLPTVQCPLVYSVSQCQLSHADSGHSEL